MTTTTEEDPLPEYVKRITSAPTSHLWLQMDMWGRYPEEHPVEIDAINTLVTYQRQIDQLSWLRATFAQVFSWARPTPALIEEIIQFVDDDKVIEICAGRGLWARLLTEKKVDIVATDNCSSHHDHNLPKFFEVIVMDGLTAVKRYYKRNVLLLIWPPQDMGGAELQAFRGNKFIYIGEPRNGQTGNSVLFDELDRNWTLVSFTPIKSFVTKFPLMDTEYTDLDDSLYCYTRKV